MNRIAGVSCIVLTGILVGLVGCSRQQPVSDPKPSTTLFDSNQNTSVGRTFECTSRGDDGSCNVNECRQGPGGATFDCASFAGDCVNAGHHWSGAREGGKCTRVL